MLECLTYKLCTPSQAQNPASHPIRSHQRRYSMTSNPSLSGRRLSSCSPRSVFGKSSLADTSTLLRTSSLPALVPPVSIHVPIPVKVNFITFHWVGSDKNAYRPFIKEWEKEGICVWSFVLPSRTIPREDKYVHDISDLANMFLDCLKTLLARSARTSTPVIVAHKNKDKDKDKDTNNAEATVSLSKQQLQNQSNDGKEQPNEPQFPTNVPIVLLGHSLGGMLAYEVARRWGTVPLFSTIGIRLSHLIVSAVPTPTVLTHLNNNIVTTTVNIRVARGHRDIISASASGSGSGRDNKEEVVKEGYHTLRENALMEHIRSLGGIPTGVDPSLVRAKLAVIRQDYATYHAYSVHHRVGFQPVLLQAEQKKEQKQNQEQESGQCCDKSTKTMNARPHDLMLPDKIACNISIFSASHDKMVDHTQMQNWGEFTWGTHEHVSFKGSHFYLIESSSSTYGGPSRAVSATDEACAGKAKFTQKVINILLKVAADHNHNQVSDINSDSDSDGDSDGDSDSDSTFSKCTCKFSIHSGKCSSDSANANAALVDSLRKELAETKLALRKSLSICIVDSNNGTSIPKA